MFRTILFFTIVLFYGIANATPIVLYDSTNNPVGTSSNPLKVNFSGNQTIDGGLYVGGNVGISSTTPRGKLDVDGAVYADNFYGNGSNLTGVSSSGVSGVTAGYVPTAASSTSLTDSVIYQNGTNVGIGTTAPQAKLDVNGAIYGTTIVTTGTAERMSGNTYPGNYIDFNDSAIYPTVNGLYTDGAVYAAVASGANVGIGTSVPATKLDVNGTIYGHGNVGIGTSVARALLDVEGGVYMMGNVGIGTSVPASLFQVGSPSPTVTTNSSPKSTVKGNFAVDGVIYNNGVRIETDGAIYSFVNFHYFKTGTTCYRCTFTTSAACAAVSCGTVGM